MIIDLDTYKASKKYIQDCFLLHYKGDVVGASSTLSCASMVPCIVVSYWIAEVSDWPKELIEQIERLKNFYGYTEILNRPNNCPQEVL